MQPDKNIVNVINLPHRPERLSSFHNQSKEQNFEYKVWEGVIDIPVQKGISHSHKNIIRYAKENNLEYVIISEDDCLFTDVGSYDYFIKNIPDKFDLYLASVSWGTIYQNNIVKLFSGLTLYICHNKFYNKFLLSDEEQHLDMQMYKLGGTYIVCNPFIAIQSEGFSDNRSKVVEYNKRYFKGCKHFSS